MLKSDLRTRVADRHRSRRSKDRVVSRWLLAKKRLAPGLKAVLPELREGDVSSATKALDDLWALFEISESPGDFGSVYTIEAEWFYPLGPRLKSRVRDLIKSIKDLRRSFGYYEGTGKPVGPNDIKRYEQITSEAAWLEATIPRIDDGFPHGDFTVVPMKGVSGKDIEECLAALDKAAGFIRKKFPQILYGKVYLGTSVGRGYGNVAIYVADHDTISLSTRIRETVGDVHAICHELGHRYFNKFWKNKDQRDQFWRLSVEPQYEVVEFDKATRAKLADEFISNAEKMRKNEKPPVSTLLGTWISELKNHPAQLREIQQLGRKFTYDEDDSVREKLWDALAIPNGPSVVQVRTNKVVREPLAVSDYAKRTNWKENFAEAFAFYVMGKPLPAEITEIFDKL